MYRPRGYFVHIGYDYDGSPVVRAFRGKQALQLIHRNRFLKDGAQSDLPLSLIKGHFHWLYVEMFTL